MKLDGNLIDAFAKWHGGVLALCFLSFAACALIALLLIFTARGDPIKMLLLGLGGTVLFGKAIARKYAAQIAASQAEQRRLNS